MRNMQFSLIVLCSALCLVAEGSTTTFKPTHGHQGQPIGDTFTFSYEPATHHMILSVGKTCYIAKMTTAELSMLHSNDGLLTVESRILGSFRQAIPIPVTDVSHYDLKHCGHNHEKYYLLHV